MFFTETWNHVPAGSTLHVRLSGDGGYAVAGSHRVERADARPLEAPLAFEHFPLAIPIAAGERHTVAFDVVFAGIPAHVHLHAEVVEPEGSVTGEAPTFTGSISERDPVMSVKLFAVG